MDVAFKAHLSEELDEQILGLSSISGGDINHAALIRTAGNDYFIKWNDSTNALSMLRAEAAALQIIANTKAIATPKIIICSSYNNTAYLLLEYIKPNPKPSGKDLFQFGVQLAYLHSHTAEDFGFENDNYIGSLPQSNRKDATWSQFYISQRLQPQLAIALNKNYLARISAQTIDCFLKKTDSLLADIYPSLLHGDLWNGNYIVSENGTSYLIDPASYFGHLEVDLAMTELFGGFGIDFYNGYYSVKKVEHGYPDRKEIYQLYYLLVHLNLFGRSYEDACCRILRKFD